MKDANVHEAAKNTSKIQGQVRKYDIFEVINSQRDENEITWHQVLLSEQLVSKKGEKGGLGTRREILLGQE